ncbi:hypothetical protein HK405_014908, partial [Cladochytrium tenue]
MPKSWFGQHKKKFVSPLSEMGPKAKGAAGGKKGKKSEADKALSEEEERKRLEEELRQQEIRAKREKELREQREREALEQHFNREKDRLDDEKLGVTELGRKIDLEIAKIEEEEESERMLCDEIQIRAARASDRRSESEQARLRTHLRTLRELILTKWDYAANAVLQVRNAGLVQTVHKNVEYPNVPFTISLPKSISLASVAIRMLFVYGPTCAEPFAIQQAGPSMSVVGGVLYLDLYEMPEPPRMAGSWTIRQILSPNGRPRQVEYPFKKASEDAAEEEDGEAAADLNIWPAQVGYRIFPRCFVHKDSARVMAWDSTACRWSEEDVGDVEIDVDTGDVKFRTTKFTPTALVQYSFAEFPLRNWSLQPMGLNKAVLAVQGRTVEIQIAIDGSKCIGLNFAGPASAKGLETEDVIFKAGIGLMASRFAFRRCPNNLQLASSKVVFQFQEAVQDTEISDEQAMWKTIMFDASFKIGESFQAVGFIVPDGEVTDETKFDVGNAVNAK